MKTKSKRRILAALGALALFLMLCVVGGQDNGWISYAAFGRGAVAAVALEAAGAFLLWKAGVLQR